MRYFDLHCDTMTTAYMKKISMADTGLQASHSRRKVFSSYEQCFALWFNDEVHGEAVTATAKKILSFYENQKAHFPSNLTPHFTIENGIALGGKLDTLNYYKTQGLKMMTLTWNGENELGYGAKTNSEKGLKDFGKRVIEKMQEDKIIIDVSHLNEQGFEDVYSNTSGSFVASHSNCFSVHKHERNLRDWQIKKLIQRQGLIGLCYYDTFLGDSKQTMENFHAHLMHIINLGGEDIVSCGSDFDGCEMGNQIKNLADVPKLNEFLAQKGVSKEQREKLFYKNAKKVFNNILLY
ncbi:MAG: membrane dipeptidase [Clostridia bacterium]